MNFNLVDVMQLRGFFYVDGREYLVLRIE